MINTKGYDKAEVDKKENAERTVLGFSEKFYETQSYAKYALLRAFFGLKGCCDGSTTEACDWRSHREERRSTFLYTLIYGENPEYKKEITKMRVIEAIAQLVLLQKNKDRTILTEKNRHKPEINALSHYMYSKEFIWFAGQFEAILEVNKNPEVVEKCIRDYTKNMNKGESKSNSVSNGETLADKIAALARAIKASSLFKDYNAYKKDQSKHMTYCAMM